MTLDVVKASEESDEADVLITGYNMDVARRLFPNEGPQEKTVVESSDHSEVPHVQEVAESRDRGNSPLGDYVNDTGSEVSNTPASPMEESHDRSHDNHVTSPANHVTPSPPSNHINHLANHMLTCSSQVTSHTPTNPTGISSLSLSSWMPRRDDLPRPSSPTAVNRVFKVVFLGMYVFYG